MSRLRDKVSVVVEGFVVEELVKRRDEDALFSKNVRKLALAVFRGSNFTCRVTGDF